MSKALLRRLREQHVVIDRKIAANQNALGYDPAKLTKLKKLKLLLKDQIVRSEAVLFGSTAAL